MNNGSNGSSLAELVQRLAMAESALHDHASGQLDAVVTASGESFLLRQAQDAMQKSEARFRALIEHSWDAILLFSAEGIIGYTSPTTGRLVGYEAAELAGRHWLDFVAPEDCAALRQIVLKLQPGDSIEANARVRRKDGLWRDMEGVVTNMLQDPGVGALVVNFRDVTERVQARQQLERIFEMSIDMICIAGFDGFYKEINPAFERILGYTLEELKAEPFLSFIHPEDQPATVAAAERLVAGNNVFLFENRHRCKNGTYRWFQWSSKSVASEQLIFAVTRDITEQKRTQFALDQLRRQHELILRSVGEGIHGIDSKGKIIFENPAAAKLLGWEADELIGQPAHPLIHHSHSDGSHHSSEQCPIYATARDGVERRRTHDVFWRKDGSSFPVDYVCTPMRDENGAVQGAVVTFRDITERLAAETEVRSAKERLQHLISASPVVLYALKLQDAEPRVLPVWTSDNVQKMLGFTAEEIASNADWWSSHLHPDHRERASQEFLAALENPDCDSFANEYQIQCKDGSYIWVRDEIQILRDSNHRPFEVVGSWSDLTVHKKAEEARRAREEDYRLLFRMNPNPMWLCDQVTCRFLDVNEAAIRHYGYSREEFLKMSGPDLRPPEDVPAYLECVSRLPSGPMHHGVWRHRRKDGSIRFMDIHTNVVTFEGRRAWLGVCADVTEQDLTQEKLRQNEAALALAQSVGHIGSWEMDLVSMEDVSGNPLRWSDEMFRIFGYEPNAIKVCAEVYWKAIYPADHEFVSEVFNQVLRDGGRYSIDHRILLPTGTERFVHVEVQLIRTADEKCPSKIVGTVQDITERRLAEERLREQAELLNLAHDAILVRDFATHRIQFWNHGAERLYGWTAEEAIGCTTDELIHSDRAVPAIVSKQVFASGEWHGEMQQHTKDGRELIVDGRATLVRNADGTPRAVLIINSDVTEHKKLESQFLRAQRLESIGTLASGVAHDLNNILAPILMSAPMLRGNLPADLLEKIASTIEISAQRGADIVRQVLTFARGIEGQRLLLQPTHLVKEVSEIAQETFPKSITISARYSDAQWPVEGDPTQLHQVLLNLCVNARDAMPQGGTLTIEAENFTVDEHYASMTPGAKPGSYVRLKVSDTGTGIPREVIDKIFDPFFTTKEVGKGTGLGLSTVLGIAKSHHGFVTVHSEVGSGTTFKVFLPAVTGSIASPIAAKAMELPKGQGELILVVDDEPGILTVTQAILKSYNYQVITASDGTEALATFARNSEELKLVITDVVMPFMDGVNLVRILKKMKPEMHFIASTGQAEQVRMSELSALNVRECLAKPYDTERLVRTVHRVLGAPC